MYFYTVITRLLHHYKIIITWSLHHYYVDFIAFLLHNYCTFLHFFWLLLHIISNVIITLLLLLLHHYYIINTIGKSCNNESIITCYAKCKSPLLRCYYILLCHYYYGFYYYPLLPISVSRTCRRKSKQNLMCQQVIFTLLSAPKIGLQQTAGQTGKVPSS